MNFPSTCGAIASASIPWVERKYENPHQEELSHLSYEWTRAQLEKFREVREQIEERLLAWLKELRVRA